MNDLNKGTALLRPSSSSYQVIIRDSDVFIKTTRNLKCILLLGVLSIVS